MSFYELPEIQELIKDSIIIENKSEKEFLEDVKRPVYSDCLFCEYDIGDERVQKKYLNINSMDKETCSKLKKVVRNLYDKNLESYSELKEKHDKLLKEYVERKAEYEEFKRDKRNENKNLEVEALGLEVLEKKGVWVKFRTENSYHEKLSIVEGAPRWLLKLDKNLVSDLIRDGTVYLSDIGVDKPFVMVVEDKETGGKTHIRDCPPEGMKTRKGDYVKFLPVDQLSITHGAYLVEIEGKSVA